jgi:Di-haem cytochrome c peroxidase
MVRPWSQGFRRWYLRCASWPCAIDPKEILDCWLRGLKRRGMRYRTVLLCGRRVLTNGRVVVPDRPRLTSSQVALGARLVMRIPRRCRWLAWLCLAPFLVFGGTVVQNGVAADFTPAPTIGPQPITPIPRPPAADPLNLALRESLFQDHRLSHDGTLACASCHDLHTNGADDDQRRTARHGSTIPFTVLSVFNAALNFRLNCEEMAEAQLDR